MLTIFEVKAWLDIPSDDSSQDANLLALEAEIASFIERQTGRSFGAVASVDEVLDGTGREVLYLAEVPAVGTLVLSYRAGIGSPWVALPSTAFEVDGRRVFAGSAGAGDFLIAGSEDGSHWRTGSRIYRAQYTAGYATGSAPADVKLAAKTLLSSIWTRRGSEGVSSESDGLTSTSYGGTSVEAAFAAVPTVQKTLNAWRRPLL